MKNKIRNFGSAWGGRRIIPELIRDNSYICSVGLSNDYSFDMEMLKLNKTIKIIGIDPTNVAKNTYDELIRNKSLDKERFILIQKALYGEKTELILGGPAVSCFSTVGNTADTITLNEILENFGSNISLLKMDIEGSEYSVLDNIESLQIDQICLEWHHWLNKAGDSHPDTFAINPYTIDDTIRLIEKIKSFGYELIEQTTNVPERIIQETLFVKKGLL